MDSVSGGESITALILQQMGALQKWSTLKSPSSTPPPSLLH